MCQISKTKKLVPLEEDMVVWKVVIPEGGLLLSSYQYYPYEYDVLVSVDPEKILEDIFPSYGSFTFTVKFGLHSFIVKNDAEMFAACFHETVVRAIIPKGSLVIDGFFKVSVNLFEGREKVPSIVSDQLILKKS